MAEASKTQADLAQRLDELTTLSKALSERVDPEALAEQILLAAQRLTGADGGTLFRVNDAGDALTFSIIRNTSLAIAMGGTTGTPPDLEPVPLTDNHGTPNHRHLASYVALTGETISVRDAYAEARFDLSGTKRFDAITGYRSQSLLAVALPNNEGEIIGVLELINATNPISGEVSAFSAEDCRFAEALASQSAVVLTQQELIGQQRQLFEGLIRLIAEAIDEKSEHTGRHCQRVPPLTMMIADAAHGADETPFEDFHMGPDQRHQLEVAAWLHDCGKVATPDRVMDKATKLHGMHDRIQEIATRFEVVKRDIELEAVRERLAACEQGRSPATSATETSVSERLAEADADCAFLVWANRGGEWMAEADQARVERMAQAYTWRDSQGEQRALLDEAERRDLCISRGTLNDEEKAIMKNHVQLTLDMLRSLPYPKHLRRVPEIAGGHHERMDGGGYPRGLVGDQNPVEARMMVIADVFEALTAPTRPYKRPNTLSEALEIMARMNADHHFDPELFDLFIRDRVYQRFAREYLDPSQIDAVDEDRIRASTPYFA